MSIKESLPDKCKKKFAEDMNEFRKIVDDLNLEEIKRDKIMSSANRIFYLSHYLSVCNFYAEEMGEILSEWEPILRMVGKTNPFDNAPVLAVEGVRND